MNFDQTEQLRTRTPRTLPTFYYHEHFVEMLRFVGSHYQHALGASHRAFIDDFNALDKRAQCLYVRLVNRKGRLFATPRLRYPEIGEVHTPLAKLYEGGWIGPPESQHFSDLLHFLTRAQLAQALAAQFTGLSRSMRKSEYVDFALENADAKLFLQHVDTRKVFVQRHNETVHYLLFLYFGRLPEGLQQFTMRDLGIVRTQNFVDEFEPRFNEREEAEEHFFFSWRLKQLEMAKQPAEIVAAFDDVDTWPQPVYPGAARLRDALATRLAAKAKQLGLVEQALQIYAQGESPECRERQVRLLLKEKRLDEARSVLEQCLAEPGSDDVWLFARDLYGRHFETSKRTAVTTDVLRAAETIDLDESFLGRVEQGAVEWFNARDMRAFRVENTLWRTLFGLLFWDELFGERSAELHSPFEWLPASLSDGSFYTRNRCAIDERLALLDDSSRLKRQLLATATRHYGTPNGVFRWRRTTLEALYALLDHVKAARLAEPLRRLCRQYHDARHGYPDLLVIDSDRARFVEIKADGDQLRKNQLLRIEQLREAGLDACVVKVRWTLDPAQAYVVVDVETTGGKGAQHRVTEIGAVRVQGGAITARFQTLLNPQRPIPSGITRLTGITQEMVADAPTFAEVADEFEAFMGNAIFVAHNVGFDYRFISQEFAHLGRHFRHAKLCTCSGMRKLFPGHRSYSLAAMSEQFGIELRQHHRALCDAEAAAQLLLLINEKRQEYIDRH